MTKAELRETYYVNIPFELCHQKEGSKSATCKEKQDQEGPAFLSLSQFI